VSWRDGSLRESSSLRGSLIKERGVSYAQASETLVFTRRSAQLGEAACGRPAACVPWQGQMKPEQLEIAQLQARGRQAEGRTRHPKKSRGLLREGIDVKFGFIAKHRGSGRGMVVRGASVSAGVGLSWLTGAQSTQPER